MALPPDTLVYAVGDIHGRLDLLDRMLEWVKADFQAAAPSVVGFLVLLGDYIDRGPESRGVVERLRTLKLPERLSLVMLRGNHEQMLLEVLDSPEKAPSWVRFGGGATMMSYGVPPAMDTATPEQWAERITALDEAIPEEHQHFLFGLKTAVEIGDYFFVHAGVNPDRPLSDQSDADMLWIRHKFLKSNRKFEKMIVHGHSAAAEPLISDYRIGIDTGAYATGTLTCLRIDGRGRSLMGIRLGGPAAWPN